MSKIVVGYTPDKYGRAALEYAAAESELRGLGLLVVNGTKGDALVDDRYAAESEIEKVSKDLQTLGVDFEVRQFMGADISDQVVALADEVDAALIVIGIRRRSPVGKLVMGSVAQRILMDSHCPVLAVKPVSD
jgi:nucleotide-binding universal stress UspA family protein